MQPALGLSSGCVRFRNASDSRAAALSELVAGRPCTDCERTYSWYVMSLQPRSAGAAYSLTDLVKRKASDATMDEALHGEVAYLEVA